MQRLIFAVAALVVIGFSTPASGQAVKYETEEGLLTVSAPFYMEVSLGEGVTVKEAKVVDGSIVFTFSVPTLAVGVAVFDTAADLVKAEYTVGKDVTAAKVKVIKPGEGDERVPTMVQYARLSKGKVAQEKASPTPAILKVTVKSTK